MNQSYIDEKQFNEFFPVDYREQIEKEIRTLSNTTRSKGFYGTNLKCFNLNWSHNPRGAPDKRKNFPRNSTIPILGDIWLSNIYSIDWVIKNLDKDSLILDFCSGMGQMIVYLSKIGYNNVYGCENYTQIEKSKVNQFLEKYNLEDRMISEKQATEMKFDLVINSDIILREPILSFDYKYLIPCYRTTNLGMDCIVRELNFEKFYDNNGNEFVLRDMYSCIVVMEKK